VLHTFCHHFGVPSADAAAKVIRSAARSLASGDGSVEHLWSVFHANLHDLCSERPLDGDYLSLFECLERWDASVPSARSAAEDDVRSVAGRLGA
jgi:hypothetical protein